MGIIFNSLSLFSLTLIQLIALSSAGTGFTADLIHRDSPKSPFYNPSATKTDRFTNAIRRSFSRTSHLQNQKCLVPNKDDVQSQVIPANGEYLMNISIGTPRFQILAIVDTGSDLSWTQCHPCKNCYKQKAPLFDPKRSSTYRALTCGTRACNAVGYTSCRKDKMKSTCQYSQSYADRSFSKGDLAVETLTFGSSSGQAISFPTKVFGCGFSNTGGFHENATGIVGLGQGPLSIVQQLMNVIDGKFSYCLVDFGSSSTSKIKFGEDAVVSGEGVVSTAIVKKEVETFYYLTLESICVGDKVFAYKTKLPSETESIQGGSEGNIIIDSGTSLTFLPLDLYGSLEDEFVRVIKKPTTEDPRGFPILCYRDKGIRPPTMTFNFKGAKVELPPSTTFHQNGDLLCLGMVPTKDLAVFGNLFQKNFLIGYDLKNSVLSFKPTDCEKQ